jgi:hypothetical protein
MFNKPLNRQFLVGAVIASAFWIIKVEASILSARLDLVVLFS